MHSSNVRLNSITSRWNFHSSLSDSILKFCETKREWNEDINYQLFSYSQLEDFYHLNNDVVKQSGFFAHGRADIFTIMTPLDFMVTYYV